MFERIKIKWARRIMRKALRREKSQKDQSDTYLFCAKRDRYRTAIAKCIYDNRRKDGRLNRNNCQAVAEKIITLVFDSFEL